MLSLEKNCFYLFLFLCFLCSFSFSFYCLYQAYQAIPSKFQSTRPNIPINNGGAKCFTFDSLWYKMKYGNIDKVEDALYLGGTDPKFIVTLQNDIGKKLKTLWKPQLPVVGHHYAMAQNEVIVYHIDCLLGLKRTPPASVFLLDLDPLERAILPISFDILEERQADWDTWKKLNSAHGAIQVLWPSVNHVNFFGEITLIFLKYITNNLGFNEDSYLYLLGATSTSIRELSTRDMLDYISGNWDRSHNQFHIYDKIRKTSELIYLDHNHLKTSENTPFHLHYCKFWEEDIIRLQSLLKNGIVDTLLNSLDKYEPEFITFHLQDKPIINLESRVKQFLEHVETCIAKYGGNYVFEE